MISSEWKEYNHALVAAVAPHKSPTEIPSRRYLQKNHLAMARWTDEWDIGYPTEWWYCIKDDAFDMSHLKAKRRYEITKGERNFFIKEINMMENLEKLYVVAQAAFAVYPEQYRPIFSVVDFRAEMEKRSDEGGICIAAYERTTEKLAGYAIVYLHSDWMDFSVQKTIPGYEKKSINAALVKGVLDYAEQKSIRYISDGSRPVRHKTQFQEYLIKYFQFRRAYCRLNIAYHPLLAITIRLMYPFRNMFHRIPIYGAKWYDLLCLLDQERIRRSF